MGNRDEYISVLKQRLQELQSTINGEKQAVHEFVEAIRAKEEQVEYIARLLVAEGVAPEGNHFNSTPQRSVSDLAYEVLANGENHQPIHYRDLADRIMTQGNLIPGQDPAANLVSHLTRDLRFVRTGRGTYGLAEWGLTPAKRSGLRRRSKRKRRKPVSASSRRSR